MHFDDLDIPVGAQPRRRVAHQMREQVDAERGVRRLQHRNARRGGVDRGVMVGGQPGRAHHQRGTPGERRIEMRLQPARHREVDEDIADPRERLLVGHEVDAGRHLAAHVLMLGAARKHRLLGLGDHLRDRAPHASARSENADPCHARPLARSRLLAKPRAIRNASSPPAPTW